MALLASALLYSCSDDSSAEPAEVPADIAFKFIAGNSAVEISEDGRQATLEIPSLGGNVAFGIETDARWSAQIEEDGQWVAVNGSGKDIIVSGPEFISDYTRRAMVRIMSDDKPIGYINVSQAGTEVATLSLDKTEVIFNEMGGTCEIAVETNRESWHIEGFEGKEWLEYKIKGNMIELTAATNKVPVDFSTVFSVVAGSDDNSKAVEVDVTLGAWSPAYIKLDRDMVIIPEEGGNLKMNVESNRLWDVSSTDSWYTVKKEDGQVSIVANPSSSGVLEGTISLKTTSGKDLATLDLPIKQYTNPYILEYTVPNNESIIAVPVEGVVNCYVDWGDGESSSYSGDISIGKGKHMMHEYAKKGVYTVKIYGTAAKMSAGYGDVIGASAPWITAVKSWGSLGATSLQYMLRRTSIKEIPSGYGDLFKNATELSGAFWDCKELETIPADLLNDIKVTGVSAFFYGCTKIKTVPATLLKGASNLVGAQTMFRGCSGLQSIPEELFAECPKLQSTVATFGECTSLKTVPAGLFANNPNIIDMNQLFSGCSSLETVPVSIFDNNKKVTNFDRAFLECTKWTGDSPYTMVNSVKVRLWERTAANGFVDGIKGLECFKGDTGLTDYDDIPTTPSSWK